MEESEKREILNSAKSYLDGFIYNNDEASKDKKVASNGSIDINKLQIDRINKALERIPVKKGKEDLYNELFRDLQNRLGSIKDTRNLGLKMGSDKELLISWQNVEDILLNPDNTD